MKAAMTLRPDASIVLGKKSIRNTRGFTLIEVVVALAILASTLYGGFFLLNRTTVNTYHLRDTVLANWVATNAYALAVLEGSSEEQQPTSMQSMIMYGQEFLVTLSREENSRDAAQAPVEDNVASGAADNPQALIAKLTIFVAKPTAPDSALANLVINQ